MADADEVFEKVIELQETGRLIEVELSKAQQEASSKEDKLRSVREEA